MSLFLIAALCGVGVGVLSGMFGVGGGTVMVPIFRLGFGMTALEATGTSLFTMIFTSIAGTITHVRNKACLVPLGILAGACGALTSPFGVRLANISPAWLVMFATAGVIAYSASTMLVKGLTMPKEGDELEAMIQKETPAKEEPAMLDYLSSTALTRKQYAIGAIAGLIAGLAGGYVGLGGGFLMVPIFITFIGLNMKQASATSLLAVGILATAGSITQAAHGNLVATAGLAMAIGSIPGAIIGAKLTKYVPERSLRILFGALLIVTSAVLAINEFMV